MLTLQLLPPLKTLVFVLYTNLVCLLVVGICLNRHVTKLLENEHRYERRWVYLTRLAFYRHLSSDKFYTLHLCRRCVDIFLKTRDYLNTREPPIANIVVVVVISHHSSFWRLGRERAARSWWVWRWRVICALLTLPALAHGVVSVVC